MTTTIKNFRIIANGTDMGTYEGADEDEALDAYAQDAGYADFADLLERVPGSSRDEVEVEEVEIDAGAITTRATEIAREVWGDVHAPCENVGSDAYPHYVIAPAEGEYGVSSADGERWGVVFADDSHPVERLQGMDLRDAIEAAHEMNQDA